LVKRQSLVVVIKKRKEERERVRGRERDRIMRSYENSKKEREKVGEKDKKNNNAIESKM
jgi:hypothetical protein